MDNLCHTLVGAALGEAGLKRTTAFGNATLMIAANLPDVDVLVFATDVPSVAFRRGWTHGVLAQLLLPPLLAGLMSGISRMRRPDALPPASFRSLLLLSYIGVISHVLLDLLNNYGVRLLMPFSQRWFYGDAVFIVDIWLWLVLGAGVWLSARRHSPEPARSALLIATTYVLLIVGSATAARGIVARAWYERSGLAPQSFMVGPYPITPFKRAVIVDAGDAYVTGTFEWFPRRVVFDAQHIPKNDRNPAVQQAISDDPRIRAVLIWARFPYFQIERAAEGVAVTLRDVRFGERVGAVRAVVSASPGS